MRSYIACTSPPSISPDRGHNEAEGTFMSLSDQIISEFEWNAFKFYNSSHKA